MSNLLLAQSSGTPEPTASAGFALVVLVLATISAYFIGKRKLYRLPAVPRGSEEPGALVLAAAGFTAFAIYLSTLALVVEFAGIPPEQRHQPEGMRTITMLTPLAQLVTAGVVMVLLRPYLPRVFHWARTRVHAVRQALAGYLLAIPWVFLLSAIVSIIVELFDLDAKKSHLLFEIWAGEDSGATVFKAVALFSAIIAAPLVEELVFRGLIQRLMHRLTGSGVLAIVVASVVFTAIHSPWTTWPPIFVLSMFLGWAYFRSGSILVPMLMHAIFNGLQFVLFMLVSGGSAA